MSKVDAQFRPTPPPLESASAKGLRFRPETPHDFLRCLAGALRAQRFENSQVARADLSKAGADVRELAKESFLNVLRTLPGFVAPTLSQPPTTAQLRDLMKQILQAEKQGLLKGESYAQARPETARKAETALKPWGDFVQAPTKGEGAKAIDAHVLLGEELRSAGQDLEGAGLRSPQFAGEPFAALNNKQKLTLMSEAFGDELAGTLKQNGIREPLAFLKAGMSADSRAQLSEQLGVPRGQLIVELSRSELLMIGPGRNGEQALRPQHLPALAGSGIVTQGQLGAVKGLSPEHIEGLYQQIRGNYSGFARAMSGGRPILKKDLTHWAKSAARKKSSILDDDWDDSPRRHGDAEEQIMAWYLHHFAELEKKHARDLQHALELQTPLMRPDPARSDGLVCYWIERPNFNADRPTFTEMIYVCLDPKTGVIDPRQKE